MTFTELLEADLKEMLLMGLVRSPHFTGRNDVWFRFGAVPVWKTVTVCLKIFDVILTHM